MTMPARNFGFGGKMQTTFITEQSQDEKDPVRIVKFENDSEFDLANV